MRRIHVNNIKNGVIVAAPIYAEQDKVLVHSGTVLNDAYIEKFLNLGIYYIFIEDEYSSEIGLDEYAQNKLIEACKYEVKDFLERYFSQGIHKLKAIEAVADEVITSALLNEKVLINLVDIRKMDEYTYAHSVNVCSMSVLIALKMGLKKEKVKEIAVAALLHDIGKNLVPADILNKREPLNHIEGLKVKQHVLYSYDAIQTIEGISEEAKMMILYHHERINGSGYPFHWKGEKIPLGARIIGLCDVFDAMTSIKVYKDAKTVLEAVEYVKEQSNSLFDSEMVAILVENVAIYPTGTGVMLSDHSKGIVIKQNRKYTNRPIIKGILEKKVIDLSKTDNLKIIGYCDI